MNTFEEIFRSDVIWSYLPVSEHPENEFKEIRNDFSLNGKNINYIGHGDKHWKIIQLGHYIFWLAKDRCMDTRTGTWQLNSVGRALTNLSSCYLLC